MANYCNKCGYKLIESSKFCNQCGARVPEQVANDNADVRVNGDPGINIYSNTLKMYLRNLFRDDDNLAIIGGSDYKSPDMADDGELNKIIINEEYNFTNRTDCYLQDNEGKRGSYFFNSKFYPLTISLKVTVHGEDCKRIIDILSDHFSSGKTVLIPIPGFHNMYYSYLLKMYDVKENDCTFAYQDALYPVLDINNENLDTDQHLVLSLLRQISYMHDVIGGLECLCNALKNTYKYLITGSRKALNNEWLTRNELNNITKLRDKIAANKKIIPTEVKKCLRGCEFFPPMLNRISDHASLESVLDEVNKRLDDARSRERQLFELLKIPENWDYQFVSEYYKRFESAASGYEGLSTPRSISVIKLCIDHVITSGNFESFSGYLDSVRNDVIDEDKNKYNYENSYGDPGINMYSNAVCKYLKDLFEDDPSISVYGGDTYKECYKTVGYTKILVHEQYNYEYGTISCELSDSDGNKSPYYFDLNTYPLRYTARLQIDTKEDEKERIREILFDHFKSERILRIPVIGLNDRYVMLKLDGLNSDSEGYYSFKAADVVYPVMSFDTYRVEKDRGIQISLLKQVLYLYNLKEVDTHGLFKEAYNYVCTGDDPDNMIAQSNYRVQLVDLRNEISNNGDAWLPLISELNSSVLGNVPFAYPKLVECIRNKVGYADVCVEVQRIQDNAAKRREEILSFLAIPIRFFNYDHYVRTHPLQNDNQSDANDLDPSCKNAVKLYLEYMEDDPQISISDAVSKVASALIDEYEQEYQSQLMALEEEEETYYSEPTYDNRYESSNESGEGLLSGIAKVAIGVAIGNKLSQPKKKPMMCSGACPNFIRRVGGGCRLGKDPNDCGGERIVRPY